MSTVKNMTADELTVALRRWSTSAGDRTHRIDPAPWLTRHGVHLTKEHTR